MTLQGPKGFSELRASIQCLESSGQGRVSQLLGGLGCTLGLGSSFPSTRILCDPTLCYHGPLASRGDDKYCQGWVTGL